MSQFDPEAAKQEQARLAEQVEESQFLADLGVLAGPMTHEFNNFVNIVLLQAAILETEMPDSGREELARLRQHGKAVAALIQEWHRYRSRRPLRLQSLDLHQALGRFLAAQAPDAAARIRLELAEAGPLVLATPGDLLRLLRFLLSNALAVGPSVTLRTSIQGDTVHLRVEDDGPAVAADRLTHLFEPVALREGTVPLELAACEAIARRHWQGRIWAENRPEGGMAIVVQMQLAPGLPASREKE